MHRAIKSRRSINTPFTPEIENSVYISRGQTAFSIPNSVSEKPEVSALHVTHEASRTQNMHNDHLATRSTEAQVIFGTTSNEGPCIVCVKGNFRGIMGRNARLEKISRIARPHWFHAPHASSLTYMICERHLCSFLLLL
ncbi:hypothetical protein SCLCIDRAFT_1224740 [Scleroderma citrinum Foug A]|uniref:Uncharacterized protein n=1 Tax=Scleroderma citrinum Foug A TaxID=1036808 RepID=A0A0C3D483_9AGAM|nr:hypothetical protein SCLCIDRAFT_1224740 [Scleroderma citrinum Foug A]